MNAGRENEPVSPDLISPIFYNAGFLLLARFVNLASRLVFVLIIARELGTANYGTYVYVQAWCLLFLRLINFGSQTVMSRSFGQGRDNGIRIAEKLLGFRIILIPLVAGICILSGWSSEANSDIRDFFLVAGLGLMGRGLALWANHFFVAKENSRKVLLLDFIFRPLEVFMAVVVLANGGGIVSLLLVYAAVWWLQAGVSFFWVKRVHPGIRPSWNLRANICLAKESGASLVVAASAVWFLQAPLAIGRQTLDADTFGQFALAMQLIQVCAMVPNSFGIAVMPALSRSFHNKGDLDRQFVLIAGPLSIIAVAALAGLAYVTGDFVIPLIFGASYAPAAAFLPFGLAVFLAPHSFALQLSNAAMARGNFKWASRAAAIAICTAITLAFLLAWHWPSSSLFLAFGGGSLIWIALLFPRRALMPK